MNTIQPIETLLATARSLCEIHIQHDDIITFVLKLSRHGVGIGFSVDQAKMLLEEELCSEKDVLVVVDDENFALFLLILWNERNEWSYGY